MIERYEDLNKYEQGIVDKMVHHGINLKDLGSYADGPLQLDAALAAAKLEAEKQCKPAGCCDSIIVRIDCDGPFVKWEIHFRAQYQSLIPPIDPVNKCNTKYRNDCATGVWSKLK